jgi:hypothetical protein
MKITETRVCIRCGSEKNIERHHIVQRIDGGSNDEDNLQNLCRACHKYEHAKRNVLNSMKGETQKERLDILKARLETLELYNTPEMTKLNGTFQSYNIRPELILPLPHKRSKRQNNILAKRCSQSVMRLEV